MEMINLVKSALQTSLASSLTGTTVIVSENDTHTITEKQVAIEADSEVFSINAVGLPIAWIINAEISAGTYIDDDKNGSTLNSIIGSIFTWAQGLTTLTVSGYSFSANLGATQGAVEYEGNLKILTTNFRFVIQKT